MEDWDDLRVALAVARAGAFSVAARLLEVNESTVVRKISHTEQRLKVRLFERKHGKVITTVAGQALVQHAEMVERVVLDATQQVQGIDSDVGGKVRVTSIPLMVNRVLIPALPKLVVPRPDLQIEIAAETRVLNIIHREADIALRMTKPPDSARLVARKVGELRYAVYGPNGAKASDLRWISQGSVFGNVLQSEWIAQQIVKENAEPPQVLVSDTEGLLACVRAGLGKTLLPVLIGDHVPGISRVEKCECDFFRELWVVVHPDLHSLNRIRAVMDWIISVCSDLDMKIDN